MERYVATQFYKADSPESRILRESGIAPSEFVLAADAQATIAALQADIKAKDSRIWELESWLQVKSPQEITLMESKIIQLEHQLTQRTAELEAANKLLYKKNCELGRFETIISDLQAELERVRGELAEAHAQLKEYY